MRVGNLRHRVQIQTFVEKADQNFGTLKTYTTIATVFAKVETVKGIVTFQTQQIEQKITHKITLRYYPHMNTEYWLLFKSRRFRIRSVTNILEKNRFMVLLCEEIEIAQTPFQTGVSSVTEALETPLPHSN